MRSFILLCLLILLTAIPAIAEGPSYAMVRLDKIGTGDAPGVFGVGVMGAIELGFGITQSSHHSDNPATYILAADLTAEKDGVFARIRSDFHKEPAIEFGPGARLKLPGSEFFGVELTGMWQLSKRPSALEFEEAGAFEIGINLWAEF